MVRIFVKLLLILVLVYTGVSIWYGRLEEKLQQDSVSSGTVGAPPPEKKTEILRKPNDYTIIVRRNIFQAVVVKTEQDNKKVEPEKLAPTKLKLSLVGTISGNERDARAIISDDVKRQQDIYQVGDSIQGAMIKAIDRGKIVLAVNGKEEVLTLKDREGGGEAYQPSAADFYQEPAEPQTQEVNAEPAEPQTQEVNAEQAEAQSTGRQPAVRPRPVRRPPITRSQGLGADHPGLER